MPSIRPTSNNGFALVIALSLMAFILLLLLSVTTLVQVETSVAQQSKSSNQARQNALLGLQEALGTLQATVGPDQRITATGNLWNAPAVGTEHLVGVWSSEDTNNDGRPDGTFQRWLVSRQDVTQTKAIDFVDTDMPIAISGNAYTSTDSNYVVLVGAGSTEQNTGQPNTTQGVVAQKKQIISNTDSVTGNFAWWVGDEGVKAKINLIDPNAESSQLSDHRAASMSMPRFSSETIEGFDFITANDSNLPKTQSQNDLLHFTNADKSAIKQKYHDTTFHSYGVQSDTRNGGLKQDLSLLFELSESDWQNSAFTTDSNTLYSNAPVVGDVSLLFSPVDKTKIDNIQLDIPYGDKELYGPTWDKLRHYYRSYKAVTNKDSSPEIVAQPASPSVSEIPLANHRERWANSASRQGWRHWLGENDPHMSQQADGARFWDSVPNQRFIRSTSGTIAPYLARVTIQVSLELTKNASDEYEGQWVLIPLVYLHNPYNIKITTRESRFLWSMNEHSMIYNVNGGAPVEIRTNSFLTANSNLWNESGQGEATFTIPAATFQPGEVLAFSPLSGNWGPNVQMQKASAGINFATGGDGLRLPLQTLTAITNDDDIFRTLYTTNDWMKFAWEMVSTSGAYDTMLAAMCMDTGSLIGFEWDNLTQAQNANVLNRTIDWEVNQLLDTRTPITTFDFYVKPVDLVYPDDAGVNTDALAFPSFVSSNPLAHTDERQASAGQGSPILSPLRIGYASDGRVDSLVLSEGFTGGGQGYWGAGIDYGPSESSILDIPTGPIHSIGNLQHVNLVDMPHYPALAIGNSFSTPFLENNGQVVNAYTKANRHAQGNKIFYDLSYLANNALWDTYYFSTIAPLKTDSSYNDPSDTVSGNIDSMLDAVLANQATLHNNRIEVLQDIGEPSSTTKAYLSDYKTSAARLLVDGSFNINSTSFEAWRAFLAGLHEATVLQNTGSMTATKITDPAAFPRQSAPNGDGISSGSYSTANTWKGFTALKEDELDKLAQAIVDEIKLRSAEMGTTNAPQPFLSLANFINRMPYSSDADLQKLGLLQAAIEKAGINDRFASATRFNTTDWNGAKTSITVSHVANANDYQNADFSISTAASAPTYLLQSDILQAIGPYISARSDTFKIRSYGESNNPTTGEITSNVWLEAIVQRMPTPVTPSATNPNEPEDPQLMGRKFKIISMRWLGKDDV